MPLLSRRRSALGALRIDGSMSETDGPDKNNNDRLRPSPTSLRPVCEYGLPSQFQREHEPPESRPPQTADPAAKRFSMRNFRRYSESHLAARAREDANKENAPPMPVVAQAGTTPAIIKTVSTMDQPEAQVEKKLKRSPFRRSNLNLNTLQAADHQETMRKSMDERRSEGAKPSLLRWERSQGKSKLLQVPQDDLRRLSTASTSAVGMAPPAYGEVSHSALALPAPRFSESSRSDGSSGENIYASTTTTHTVSTHTTFWKLPKRNKNRNSLFPLPVRIPPPPSERAQPEDGLATPRASMSAVPTKSLNVTSNKGSLPGLQLHRRHTDANTNDRLPPPLSSPTGAAFAKSSLTLAAPGGSPVRINSQRSVHTSTSSPLQPPMRLGLRDRASTASSFGRLSEDVGTPPGLWSARNSTSTSGRASLGGLLSFSRLRQGSGPDSPRHGSPCSNSKSSSFAMSREALVIPEREEGDTPGKYLERLEAAVSRNMIAGILSRSADPFAQNVLRSYTRRFPFFGEPIDMSLRKFLLEAELPKETQQVDRVVQAFADRYHECNPGNFVSPDQAYIIAFSLMMLHTDAFNKNNKRKMQKQDYVKNTSGQHVSDEILGCFYDNICYTPFVHYDEEVDINGERMLPFKPKKSKLKGAITENGKKPSGPIDPYTLLIEAKLDMLRPSIKDSISMDDPYTYLGSNGGLDVRYLQRAFTHTGILQIISARSRPNAYESQEQRDNAASVPTDTQAGVVDLKVTKVGTLWRKATKRKKARSPWQEWGAILTGSQLYLFKNAPWVKNLVHQYHQHQKHGSPRTPVVFKPPLTVFKPDALIKTDNAVALVDSTYTRHKHAFAFVRPGGQEEFLLADNETEVNDWLGLINYAAAFRVAGVRIRGMVGAQEEDTRTRDVQRLKPTQSTKSVQAADGNLVSVQRAGLSPHVQRQVMAARRQIMLQKIQESDKEVAEATKRLDDMLRTARHLQVLAPIQQKTRDEVVHAAARVDANLKWVRRDIWRTKCHRDILAMDVQEDGVPASEFTQDLDQQVNANDAAARANGALSRLASKVSAARSPPQSPQSPTSSARPGTHSSVETFVGTEVFRTPPESAKDARMSDPWKLPPLNLTIPNDQQHSASVSCTLLSVSPRQPSLSHASSTSSVRRPDIGSSVQSDTGSRLARLTPTPSVEERELESLAKNSLTPEPFVPSTSRTMPDGGPSVQQTPESSKHKSVRRSLQKTLREAHHHPGSNHRHRKSKDSERTVRSVEADEQQEGTPGLERANGRFILHGKQASVIHFQSDWPNERMRVRRELWRQSSGSPVNPSGQRPSEISSTAVSGTASSNVHERGTFYDTEFGESTSTAGSFEYSAEAAAAYAAASPHAMWSSDDEGVAYFDLSAAFDPDHSITASNVKRQTIIGPQPNKLHREGSLDKGENGAVIIKDSDDDPTPRRGNRVTVIGPSTQVNGERHAKNDSDNDEELTPTAIDDEDLRRLSETNGIGAQQHLQRLLNTQVVEA